MTSSHRRWFPYACVALSILLAFSLFLLLDNRLSQSNSLLERRIASLESRLANFTPVQAGSEVRLLLFYDSSCRGCTAALDLEQLDASIRITKVDYASSRQQVEDAMKKYGISELPALIANISDISKSAILQQLAQQRLVGKIDNQTAIIDIYNTRIMSQKSCGAPGAVTLTEFADFKCPFCYVAKATVDKLTSEYGKKLIFNFRHYPLESLHPGATLAAQATECARDQGRFEQMYEALWAQWSDSGLKQDVGKKEVLLSIAANVTGMNLTSFTACLDNGTSDAVARDVAEGNALGVRGTPSFLVNCNIRVKFSSYDNIKSVIDAELG